MSVVEHKRAERREEILSATWRLIAEQGMRAANMRSLAAAAGYANGALAYYFAGKEDLLRAAFEHVFRRTGARIEQATRGRRGLEALRALCCEIMPMDAEKVLEARIVIPFWQEAMHETTFAELHESAMRTWRAQIRRHLRQAAELGEIHKLSGKESGIVVEQLLAILNGTQVLAVLSAEMNSPTMLRANLDRFLAGLAASEVG